MNEAYNPRTRALAQLLSVPQSLTAALAKGIKKPFQRYSSLFHSSKTDQRALRDFVAQKADDGIHDFVVEFVREDQRRDIQRRAILSLLVQAEEERKHAPGLGKTLSIEDTARWLMVSVRTVHCLANMGWLHRWKVGQNTFFSRSEIEAIVIARPCRSY